MKSRHVMTEFFPMAKEVVFIADDLGMSGAINDAILYAHTEGRLGGAALMMGQPGTDDAVRLAREHPRLQVGWHLHLTDSQPVTTARWPWGSSPARAGWAIGLLPSARRLMEAEVARQWELFQSTGLPCRFINSHHHLHVHPFVHRAMRRVVGDGFSGWLRLGRPSYFPPRGPDALIMSFTDRLFTARRRDHRHPSRRLPRISLSPPHPHLSRHAMPARPLIIFTLALLLPALAHAYVPPPAPAPHPLEYPQDTYAFKNETVWNYGNGTVQGGADTTKSQRQYTRRCFVLSRSLVQFWKFATFDPNGKRLDDRQSASGR
jgi:hypothetical protein